jgi:hypothetical protein
VGRLVRPPQAGHPTMQQLGFGFGKGRRVVKTTIAVEAATQALVKQQQRWVDQHWRRKPASKKLRMAKAALKARSR